MPLFIIMVPIGSLLTISSRVIIGLFFFFYYFGYFVLNHTLPSRLRLRLTWLSFFISFLWFSNSNTCTSYVGMCMPFPRPRPQSPNAAPSSVGDDDGDTPSFFFSTWTMSAAASAFLIPRQLSVKLTLHFINIFFQNFLI